MFSEVSKEEECTSCFSQQTTEEEEDVACITLHAATMVDRKTFIISTVMLEFRNNKTTNANIDGKQSFEWNDRHSLKRSIHSLKEKRRQAIMNLSCMHKQHPHLKSAAERSTFWKVAYFNLFGNTTPRT